MPLEESPDGKTITFRRYNKFEPFTHKEIRMQSKVADERVREAQAQLNKLMRVWVDSFACQPRGPNYWKQLYMGNWEVIPMKTEFERQVLDEVSRDGKIAGIKMYRNHYGCGLKEAKDAVEALVAGRIPPDPATYKQVKTGDKTYEQTMRTFNLENLVADQACISGLSEVLNWCIANLRTEAIRQDGLTHTQFKRWFEEVGYQHLNWLVSNCYLIPVVEKVWDIEVGDRFMMGPCEFILVRAFVGYDSYVGLVAINNGNTWHNFIKVELGTSKLTIKQFEDIVGPNMGDIETTLKTQVKQAGRS